MHNTNNVRSVQNNLTTCGTAEKAQWLTLLSIYFLFLVMSWLSQYSEEPNHTIHLFTELSKWIFSLQSLMSPFPSQTADHRVMDN